jgi:ABC-2 type transport system permease protein
MAVLLGQAARGLPLSDSARPFAALAALATLYTVLAFLRLRSLARSTSATMTEPEPEAAAVVPSRGIGGAFAGEWRRVLGIRGAFILLVLAPWVYGLYYPQPFLNQILRKIPIAVVDNDLSELSRSIIQTLDASGAVSVAVQAETLAAARAALDRGDAFAVVGIPPETERDVLKGTTVHVPIYADATYLFIFRSMANGIAVAINTPPPSLPPAARAPMGASSRRCSRRGARPRSCCSRSSTPSEAMAASSCRRPSCCSCSRCC